MDSVRSLLLLTVFATGLAVSAASPVANFTVDTEIDLPDGYSLILEYSDKGHAVKDTAVIDNGKARFSGTVDRVNRAFLRFHNTRETNNYRALIFYLEPSDIRITIGDTDNVYRNTSISGSKTQQEADELRSRTDSVDNQISTFLKSLRKESAAGPVGNPKSVIDSLTNVKRSILSDFIYRHPESLHSLSLLDMQDDIFSPDTKLNLFRSLSDNIKAEKPQLEKQFLAETNVMPGKKAPELTGTDPTSNKSVRLSDMKGKPALVYFWASWCGACRISQPHIKKMFDKYHDKGLEVIQISCDININAWKKHIEDNGLDRMTNIHEYSEIHANENGDILRENNSASQAENYGAVAIPAIFLIDRQGRIIRQYNSSGSLEAAINTELNKGRQ